MCLAKPLLTRRQQLVTALAATACGAGWSAIESAQRPQHLIRFSHVVAADTPKGIMATAFARLVHAQSQGRIQIKVYPDSSLYGDHNELQALQLGGVEMLAPSLSKFGRLGFPEFELFDLPYFFTDIGSVRRLTQGSMGQHMLQRLKRQQMVGLGFLDNGFKHMSAYRPLLEPADFKDLRMRIQSSKVIASQMRVLGAHPIALSFGETYTVLKTGVVDGTENPLSNFWTQKLYKVQSDLSLTQHGYLGYAIVMHEAYWASMSRSDQALIQQAMHSAIALGNQDDQQEAEGALLALQKEGLVNVHHPTALQLRQLRQATAPTHALLAQRIDRAWMDQARWTVGH
jgi:C4-dicarboxylate-binding protein DctP